MNYELSTIIDTIYFLLLNRGPDPYEKARTIEVLVNVGSSLKLLLAIADSDERKKLVGNRRIYIARKPEIPLIELLKFIKNMGDEARTLAVIVSEEYMLSLQLWQLAVTVQKKSDNNASPTQILRMLQIASRTNYLDYTWIEHRARAMFGSEIANIWPSSSFLKEHLSCQGDSPSNETLAGITQNPALLADAYAHDLYENLDIYSPEDILENISMNCDILHLPGYAKRKIASLFKDILGCHCRERLIDPHVRPTLLNIGGLGSSGSSAVYDYMKDSDDCTEVFPTKAWPYFFKLGGIHDVEPRIFWGEDSLFDIYNCLDDKARLDIKIIRFILRHILTFIYPSTSQIEELKRSTSLFLPATSSPSIFCNYIDVINDFSASLQSLHHCAPPPPHTHTPINT